MENIDSPFGKLYYLGDLLSTAYPTTVVYHNDKNEPIITEWLDEDDNGDLNIIFKTTIQKLEEFLKGIISHLEFISSSVERRYYAFYDSIDSTKFRKIRLNPRVKKALPTKTSYFNEKFSEDFKVISEHFDLQPNDDNKEEYFEVLKGFSKDCSGGLLRLHLNEGINVGHGTADTKALGRILLGYENLYESVALDVITGIDRNAKTNNLPNDISVIDMSSTEVYIQEAASYSIYLKSKIDTKSISNDYDFVSDEIFSKVNDAISVSTNKRSLESSKLEFSSLVFNNLAIFSEIIMNSKVVLDIDYFNSNSNTSSRNVIKPSEAHTIHNNIISYSKEKIEKIEEEGQFTNLNINTGYFGFKTAANRVYSGYVDPLIKENMVSFNFKGLYKVVIAQKTTVRLNSKDGDISESLVSCLEIDDNRK
jgi:hypothetical protein